MKNHIKQRHLIGNTVSLFILCILWILSAIPVSAQIPLSGGAYSQDFDSLASANGAAWTNGITLPGWYASKSVSPNMILDYRSGSGDGKAGGLYSFGENGSAERALGSLASGGTGRLAYGVRFINDTDVPLTGFRVSYTGEEWRVADANTQTLEFSFQIGTALTNADAREDEAWTPVPALDFRSPNTNATQALDGNHPADQAALAGIELPGVVVPPGQELFLRWLDVNDAGYDDGLAVDNLTVAFQPAAPPLKLPAHGAFSLLTYNTHGHSVENWSTNSWQVRAIGRELRYLNADVIALNEIPDTNTYQMANWVKAFLPGYYLATNSGSDGYIRNVILSRYPILHSQSWLCNSDLAPFGYTNNTFKRDLFEAVIAMPNFPQPLHVFSVHLKSGQSSGVSAERAAQAAAISNFLVTGYLTSNRWQPYVLCGDFNEDVARPPASHPQSVQRLISAPTGLHLTTPLNPITGSEKTFSIQSSGLAKRYDYILPCGLLFSNIAGSEVFRTDLLTNPPRTLRASDDRVASDHLPVMMVFSNPYTRPFRLFSIAHSDQSVTVRWESVPGQRYWLEASSNLASWTRAADGLLATGAHLSFHTNVAAQRRFFRVRRLP